MRTRRKTIKEILGFTQIDQHMLEEVIDSDNSSMSDEEIEEPKTRKKTQSISPKKIGQLQPKGGYSSEDDELSPELKN